MRRGRAAEAGPHEPSAPSYATAAAAGGYTGRANPPEGISMKVILWIIAIIFLIGLAVVLGIGGLIF
jgi:hypothetical protein